MEVENVLILFEVKCKEDRRVVELRVGSDESSSESIRNPVTISKSEMTERLGFIQ